MLKIINTILVVTLLGAAFVVYSLEYSIREGERDIALAKKKTKKAEETIRLLNAEWSLLSRPERLQRLAIEHLKLQPAAARQIVSVKTLASRIPERPAIDPSKTKNDPIAKMLRELN